MEKNWSISLEHDEYENDIDLIIKDAINAVEETSPGCYVNIVTPACFGEPTAYLTPSLSASYISLNNIYKSKNGDVHTEKGP